MDIQGWEKMLFLPCKILFWEMKIFLLFLVIIYNLIDIEW